MLPPMRKDANHDGPRTTRLTVEGMNCHGCAQNVSGAALKVPAVERIEVRLADGSAVVHWRADAEPAPAEVCRAIRAAGHPARVAEAPVVGESRFQVSGMTCGNCAAKVRDAAAAVPGVALARVELETATLTVEWQPDASPAPAAVLAALKKTGYPAHELAAATDASAPASAPPRGWGFNVALGGSVFLLLLAGEWILGWGGQAWFHWLAFGLGTVVQVLCGGRFYRGAWRQLKAGHSNMDTLVALGSTAAYGYSVAALLSGRGGHLYFMEAVGIISLISVGHWLEGRASARAADALRALLHLAPATARRLNAAGVETEVPVARLGVGDRVLLKPGDRVPVDGEVVEGEGAFDEAMLTGESLPVDKAPGDRLYAGTINQTGRVVMRVTATGDQTALAGIIAVVQRAQASRASIQRLADRVSSVFVPIVVLVAAATAVWWGFFPEPAAAVNRALGTWLWPVDPPAAPLAAAVIHAAAVLIVACPCALGLATPIAIMAGANAAARRGILIRDGEALEKSGRIDTVVFDKTGTLTEGRPTVAAWEDLRGDAAKPPLPTLVAALASGSTHPLSRALAGSAADVRKRNASQPKGDLRDLPISDWREVRGAGVEATLAPPGGAARQAAVSPAGSRPVPRSTPSREAEEETAKSENLLRLGALDWLAKNGVADAETGAFVTRWRDEGATVLGLARGTQLLGRVALRDALKPAAAGVVRRLRRQGLAVHLLTGDNPRTALALAREAGIPAENVQAGVRPEAKADRVQALQTAGRRVAFVGDGINDAPALEQADLGVAVSRASDVAREAADLILLRSDIEAVPEALGLARATLRTIHQNLFWAFFYNAAAVPLAAFGFLSPLLCAAAMGFSDLIVIGNALRLRRWRAEKT